MALLTRDQILKADDRKYEVVACPEWGGDVRLRSLTGKERDAYENSLSKRQGGKVKQNMDNFRARLVALCAVDEDGNLLFTNSQDILMLGEKSVAPLQRLFNKCTELNGMSDEDVEELAEDFVSAPDGSSTSD